MSRLYEQAFTKVLFPVYESGLRRRRTLDYLAEAQANQWLPPERIAQLQWRKLEALVGHCARAVPYYRQRWREFGIDPKQIQSPADYARLPVLRKADVRANFDALHAEGARDQIYYKTTGGSTGEPMRFGYTRESYDRRIAAMWRGYAWAGATMGRRTLYLWGASIGVPLRAQQIKERLYHAMFNRRMLNAFLMNESRMLEYAAKIESFKPEIIVSYVAPILRMAEWMLATGTRPHRPEAIVSAAEALHPAQRATIERAFGCPVFNTYGCREVMLIAAECERRDGLHLTADHLCVELDQPTMSTGGEAIGEVVLTDLHNFGMPLLRYANGDLATAASGACACGRGLGRFKRIDGRKLDTLRTPAGHLLPGEFIVYAFLPIQKVKRYQVVQRELGALDIYLVPDAGFGPAIEQQIRDAIIKAVGDSVALRFHLVEDIAASASGKFRVTICELA